MATAVPAGLMPHRGRPGPAPHTVLRIRRQFVADGLSATQARKRPDRVYERSLNGREEAQLIALACSSPPDGQAR